MKQYINYYTSVLFVAGDLCVFGIYDWLLESTMKLSEANINKFVKKFINYM